MSNILNNYLTTPIDISHMLINKLKYVLKKEPTVEEIFKIFQGDKELITRLEKYVEVHLMCIYRKSNDFALEKRANGVVEFNKRSFHLAVCYFNDSLVFTRNISTEVLATTYCCRAATFFALDLYDFCMDDLKRAESLGYPEKTKFVLFYNLACCHYKLMNFESALVCANRGIDCLETLRDENVENVQELFKILKFKAELKILKPDEQEIKINELNLGGTAASCNCLETKTVVGILNCNEKRNVLKNGIVIEGLIRVDFSESHVYEDFFEFMDQKFSSRVKQDQPLLNSMKVRNSSVNHGIHQGIYIEHNEHGFSAKASKEIGRGQILMVNKSYVGYVHRSKDHGSRFIYCAYCFERADAMMIPCHYCTAVRFCSEQCRDSAWEEFHYVECGYDEILSKYRTECLTMRILLKVGIKKLARLSPVIPLGTETIKDNLSDPMEYYNFFYSLPFMETLETKAEAVVGVSLMLIFLEQMYSLISNVEDGSVMVEDVKNFSSVPIRCETLTEDEKINLGLRMVKHCLQIRSGYSINWKRPYVLNVNKDDIMSTGEDFIGFNVYPLLGFFTHSCYSNLQIDRLEKGILILTATRQIKEGELLTVEIFSNQFHSHQNSCECDACAEERSIIYSNTAEIERIRNEVTEIDKLYGEKKHDEVFRRASLLLCKVRGETTHDIKWFWELYGFLICKIGQYLQSEFLRKEKNSTHCIEVEGLMNSFIIATQTLLKIDFSDIDSEEINLAYLDVIEQIRILRGVSIIAQSTRMQFITEWKVFHLLKLVRIVKESLLKLDLSFTTHFDNCRLTILESGETWLEDLINSECDILQQED